MILNWTPGGTISAPGTGMLVGSTYVLSWYEYGWGDVVLTVTAGDTQDSYDSIELSALHKASLSEWTKVSVTFTATASSMVFRWHDPGTFGGAVFLDAISLVPCEQHCHVINYLLTHHHTTTV